jgi:hypothetical protein
VGPFFRCTGRRPLEKIAQELANEFCITVELQTHDEDDHLLSTQRYEPMLVQEMIGHEPDESHGAQIEF